MLYFQFEPCKSAQGLQPFLKHLTSAGMFNRDSFGLQHTWERAANPAWSFLSGKGDAKEGPVTFLCIYSQ